MRLAMHIVGARTRNYGESQPRLLRRESATTVPKYPYVRRRHVSARPCLGQRSPLENRVRNCRQWRSLTYLILSSRRPRCPPLFPGLALSGTSEVCHAGT
ncbi:hypothetical protein KC354_g150 [Hortaea werneckii]|nr:hypothetical protein KC354_g150 [Hortaea werneckii]